MPHEHDHLISHIERVETKLDQLFDVVVRAHVLQMRNIDEETTDLGNQLKEIASDINDPAFKMIADRLRAHAKRLDAIGKQPSTTIPKT